MNYNTLKTLLTQKRINVPALAKEIGMSKAGLYLAIDNERLTVENLEKITKVLDVPISDFFDSSPSVINKNRIYELENAIEIFEDRIYDKIRLERIFASSMFDVADAYHQFIETLSPDQKQQLDRNETYIRFQRLLLESINEITFKSDMREIENMKKQKG